MNKKQLIKKIIDNLSNDLRHVKYRDNKNKLAGHCYVASEAIYHLLGGKESGWKAMFIKHDNEPHWFIKHIDGEIIDITAKQFYDPVPYEKARGIGFLTKKPSKRSLILLNRIQL